MTESRVETMYLSRFRMAGFRSCRDVSVDLQPTLTLLVGENNAGKSNLIDALRLATPPLTGRRTRYFDDTDLSRGCDGPITLSCTFANLSRFQRAQHIGAFDPKTQQATLATRYHLLGDRHPRGRIEQLAGTVLGPDGESENRDQVNHVYLAPLRDAQRELDSASGRRLGHIMKSLVSDEDQEAFLTQAHQSLDALSGDTVITTTRNEIQSHVSDLTTGVRGQHIDLEFEKPEITRLARSLRLKMSEFGVAPTDLNSTGLGYTNLLYLATVVLELQRAQTSELTLFLVEEPEAHLHPQLQAVLLDYLRDQAERSVRDDSQGPAGRIQVIATTHSPNLASAVGTNNVVVLRSRPAPKENGGAVSTSETAALPLAKVSLELDARRKIDQYLDVTRSELLFTNRVILVEGLAEAVLIPAFVRHCLYGGEDEESRSAHRRFRGGSVIAIGSVDFAPYVRLLLEAVDGVRLADLVIVVTDGDPVGENMAAQDVESRSGGADDAISGPGNFVQAVAGGATNRPGSSDQADAGSHPEPQVDTMDGSAPYNRALSLKELGDELGAGDCLFIAESPHTLEADLFVPGSTNGSVLRRAYLAQHPRSAQKWDAVAETNDPAQSLYEALHANDRFLAKGQFAHDVAQLIAAGEQFTCPDHLASALTRFVCEPARPDSE